MILFGPLAATGYRSACGRELVAGAIDEPRAGGVHALKRAEIEGHAFRVLSRRKERGPGRLQLMPGGDDPLPGQRQHHAVLAVLSGYGRRRVHQALRPSRKRAHIAPTGDCRANRTASPARTGSGRQQIRYESETLLYGLRFADKASRIFVQARRPGRQDCRVVLEPFLSAPPRPANKASANQGVAESRALTPRAAPLCRGGHPASSHGRQSLRRSSRPPAPIRDAREGTGHKKSRNQRRDAWRDSPRERQSQFAPPPRRARVMAPNGLIPHDGSALRRFPAAAHPKSAASALSPSLRL